MVLMRYRVYVVKDGKKLMADGIDIELVPRMADQPKGTLLDADLDNEGNEELKFRTSSPLPRTSLDYLSRPKKPRKQLRKKAQVSSGPVDTSPMAAKKAPYDQSRPVMNLINTTRSRHATTSYEQVAYRMCPESAVIATQEAMGAMEDVFGLVYPDPRYRPTFRIGTLLHNLWEEPIQKRPGSVYKDELEDVLSHRRAENAGFTVSWRGWGSLVVGPALLRGNDDMLDILDERSKNADYLVDTLSRFPELRTRQVDQNISLFKRFAKMTPNAVIGPLCALYECSIQDVFTNPESQQIGLSLIMEIWRVIRNDVYKPLSLEVVAEFVQREIDLCYTHPTLVLHPILDQVMDGRESDVGPINGWIVERGMQLKPPVDCPTHRAIIELVEQKTEQQRKLKEAEQEAARKELDALFTPPRGKNPDKDHGGPLLDKEEISRMKREQRWREELGKQHMPERYVSPKISPLGNSKIKRTWLP
jgi:ketopantoate reductase